MHDCMSFNVCACFACVIAMKHENSWWLTCDMHVQWCPMIRRAGTDQLKSAGRWCPRILLPLSTWQPSLTQWNVHQQDMWRTCWEWSQHSQCQDDMWHVRMIVHQAIVDVCRQDHSVPWNLQVVQRPYISCWCSPQEEDANGVRARKRKAKMCIWARKLSFGLLHYASWF